MTRKRAESLTRRSLGGAIWVMSGHGAQAVVQAVAVIVFARLLTPRDFGLVGAATVVVGVSQIFSELGIGPAIVQRPELADRHIRTGFWMSLVLGLLLACVVALGASPISSFFRMEDLVPLLQVSALTFVISGPGSVAAGLMQRDLRFKELSVIRLSSYALGYLAVGLPLAAGGAGAWALVGASLAQRTGQTIAVMSVRPHAKSLRVDRRSMSELTYFGSGQTLAQVFNYTATQVDNLVVGRWLGAEALGLYGRAYQLMVTPSLLLGQAINVVLFPAMAQVQDSPEKIARAFKQATLGSTMVMLPVSACVIATAPEIVGLVLGQGWDGVVGPFRILAGGIALRTTYTLGEALVRAKGAVFRGAWRQAVFAITATAGAWVGQLWGLSGVAWGILAALAIKTLLMVQLSLALSDVDLRGFLTALRPAVLLTALAASTTFVVANGMRGVAAPSIAVLGSAGVSVLVVGAAALRFAPDLVLGRDGREAAERVRAHFR